MDNFSFDNVTMGISNKGLDAYIENLKLIVIEESQKKLMEYDEVLEVVGNSWRGQSAQVFLSRFKNQVESACLELGKIEKSIDDLFVNIKREMINEDVQMIDGINMPFASATTVSRPAHNTLNLK